MLNPTFSARRLKTDDPRVVDRYLFYMKEELDKQNIKQRTDMLYNHMSIPMTEIQVLEYEAIDRDRQEAAQIAEKKYRKLRMGKVRWCPTLQRARDRIKYFTLSKRKKLGRKVSSCILNRLSKRTGSTSSHLTLEELEKEIKNAYTYYRALKKQNYKLRADFLDSLAATLSKRGKGKKANIVKNLLQRENQREMFRKLAALNRKNNDLSTKCVTINTAYGKQILTDKIQKVKAIENENIEKIFSH